MSDWVSIGRLKKIYEAMTPDERAAVDKIVASYKLYSDYMSRMIFMEAIDVVRCRVNCTEPCCNHLSKRKRLQEAIAAPVFSDDVILAYLKNPNSLESQYVELGHE